MKRYEKRGRVEHGHYVGGEWCVDYTSLVAKAPTLDKLDEEIERMTKQHSSDGSTIDFGFRSNVKKVLWDDEILKVKILK